MSITMPELIKTAKEGGSRFFDKATFEFFQSIIHETIYRDKYFITSEQPHTDDIWEGRRRWTIRRFEILDGKVDINTVGELGDYESLDEAIEAIAIGAI